MVLQVVAHQQIQIVAIIVVIQIIQMIIIQIVAIMCIFFTVDHPMQIAIVAVVAMNQEDKCLLNNM